MKQGSARQYSRHRDHTPSALRLPPPKPPVVAKRPVAIVPEAAIALPETPEPLVTEHARPAPVLSRQARRKALRAEAKALRREGQPPVGPRAEPEATAALAPAAMPAPPEPEAVTREVVPARQETEAPLPRSQSLVTRRPGGIALFAQRLRRIFAVKQAYAVPARQAAADSPIAAQLRGLRDELSALQQSLDRMIEGIAA